MKKLFIFFVLSLLLVPNLVFADFDATRWLYEKDILSAEPGLNSFAIDDELFEKSEQNLRDLRLIDSDKQEVPFKLLESRAKSESKTYVPNMLNKSYSEGESSSVILDFGINNQGVNALTILTSSENFQTSVRVSGSDDRESWRTLKEGIYIYDYTDRKGNVKTQNTTVSFPESVYRFLKLEILDSSVRINSVTGRMNIKKSAKELKRSALFSQKENDDKNSEVFIDLMQSGIPTTKLVLSTKNKNFNRSVALYASFNNEDWRRVDYAYIFRYDTPRFKGENLVLDFFEVNEQYLKLVIDNQDNAPITISKVVTYSIYHEIVFEAETGKAYKVFYGNQKAKWPQYDFEKYFQYLDLSNVNQVDLSEERANPGYVDLSIAPPDPRSEKIPWLMPAALLSACAILLLMIFQFFRHK